MELEVLSYREFRLGQRATLYASKVVEAELLGFRCTRGACHVLSHRGGSRQALCENMGRR